MPPRSPTGHSNCSANWPTGRTPGPGPPQTPTPSAGRRRVRAAADARLLLNRKRNQILAQFLFAGVAYDELDAGVTRIDLDNSNNVPGVVPLIKEFPEVESISASTSRFTDAEAKHLADLPNLRDLNLYRSSIGDEGLKHLAEVEEPPPHPDGRDQGHRRRPEGHQRDDGPRIRRRPRGQGDRRWARASEGPDEPDRPVPGRDTE